MQQRAVILFLYQRSTSNALVRCSTPLRGCFLVSHMTLAPQMVISLSLVASEARPYEARLFSIDFAQQQHFCAQLAALPKLKAPTSCPPHQRSDAAGAAATALITAPPPMGATAQQLLARSTATYCAARAAAPR